MIIVFFTSVLLVEVYPMNASRHLWCVSVYTVYIVVYSIDFIFFWISVGFDLQLNSARKKRVWYPTWSISMMSVRSLFNELFQRLYTYYFVFVFLVSSSALSQLVFDSQISSNVPTTTAFSFLSNKCIYTMYS